MHAIAGFALTLGLACGGLPVPASAPTGIPRESRCASPAGLAPPRRAADGGAEQPQTAAPATADTQPPPQPPWLMDISELSQVGAGSGGGSEQGAGAGGGGGGGVHA